MQLTNTNKQLWIYGTVLFDQLPVSFANFRMTYLGFYGLEVFSLNTNKITQIVKYIMTKWLYFI